MIFKIPLLIFSIISMLLGNTAKEDAAKAMNEIIQISKKWSVKETKGTIKYNLVLTLNGKSSGTVGTLKGSADVKYKKKVVKVKVNINLTKSSFSFVTKYPSLTTVFAGTMISTDEKKFPLKKNVSKRETLILKFGKLCPKNNRFSPKCLTAVK